MDPPISSRNRGRKLWPDTGKCTPRSDRRLDPSNRSIYPWQLALKGLTKYKETSNTGYLGSDQ